VADVADVAIVGSGPAGLALAAACARRGLATVVIGEDLQWTQTLGTWVDDLQAAEDAEVVAGCLRVRWPIVTVTGSVERSLHREYAVFDNAALAALLAPQQRVSATATGVTRSDDHHVVACADGSRVAARLVVDCGGARSSLLARQRRGAVPVQSAYGVFTSGDGLVRPGTFTMMDWSTPFTGHPTFLYAMDLGGGRSLVEETSLVGRTDVPAEELRRRLLERFGRDSIEGEVETVSIPMGGRLPQRSTTVVGFGAAAGFIHPVTGYSVAASLRAAPRVAATVARSIGDGLRGPALVEATWRGVWPADLLRTRALHDYGLAALQRLDAARIGEFFDVFFSRPQADWADYLRIDTPANRIAAIMTGFFAAMPTHLRLRVMGTSPRALAGLVVRRP
jgi:lycopene beta-cyclase